MILKSRYAGSENSVMGGYCSELTAELDKYVVCKPDKGHRHYVLADKFFVTERCLPIRFPGTTIGGIYLDENENISRVTINARWVGTVYPADINEWLKRFVGERIERVDVHGNAIDGGV